MAIDSAQDTAIALSYGFGFISMTMGRGAFFRLEVRRSMTRQDVFDNREGPLGSIVMEVSLGK